MLPEKVSLEELRTAHVRGPLEPEPNPFDVENPTVKLSGWWIKRGEIASRVAEKGGKHEIENANYSAGPIGGLPEPVSGLPETVSARALADDCRRRARVTE